MVKRSILHGDDNGQYVETIEENSKTSSNVILPVGKNNNSSNNNNTDNNNNNNMLSPAEEFMRQMIEKADRDNYQFCLTGNCFN